MRYIRADWDDIERLCEVVADKIRHSGFRPEVIVAVSRGGLPPARILSDMLGVNDVASVSVRYYRRPGEREEKPVITCPLNADVRGKKVLIVDDVADTGHSLQVVREHVLGRGASEVRIATLHYKPWSVLKPDYYAEETDAWVIYAWEKWETVRSLMAKMADEGVDEEEAIKNLIGIGFDRDFVEKVLSRPAMDEG